MEEDRNIPGLLPIPALARRQAGTLLAPSSRISSFALFASTVLDNLAAISLDSPADARKPTLIGRSQ
jgi:hypothetical protein